MGLFNAITVTCKTLVSEVCGTEHETVGMGALTSKFQNGLGLWYGGDVLLLLMLLLRLHENRT